MKIIIYGNSDWDVAETGKPDFFVTNIAMLKIISEKSLREAFLFEFNKPSIIIENLGSEINGIYEDPAVPELQDSLGIEGGFGYFEKLTT